MNVRHILISVSDTSDEAAMDDAKLKAEDLLAQYESGDVGIVQTDYGYHVVYFVGYSDTTYQSYLVENALRENDYTAWESSLTDGVTYTLNAKAAKRGGKK